MCIIVADTFENGFEGWNCETITDCGSYLKICGGYGVKGKNDVIEKTFDNLPAGEKVQVTMDFISISEGGLFSGRLYTVYWLATANLCRPPCSNPCCPF